MPILNVLPLLALALLLSLESFWRLFKKMVFQGKPWNDDNRKHLIIELGDVMWYVAQACMALDISFDEVIEGNIKKLEKRYPGGKFDINYSEVRAEDDL